MEFIDFFAGIGGFRRGLELAGHKCIGFCEWDKYAVMSYTAMHCITEEQREYLSTLDFKKRQKEILKDEYRNGEWYAADICGVVSGDLPHRGGDCWCFGAPCQDFSVAGHRAGLEGNRSILVREIFRLLEGFEEEDRPEWIIYENVKGMLSSNNGLDYLSILSEMDRLGYDIQWQNINSAWYVPQNRERIYTIGHLRRFGTAKVLPIEAADGENSISIIGHRDGYRRNTQTFAPDGITEALSTCQGGGREHHVAQPCFFDMTYNSGLKLTDKSHTLLARYYKGPSARTGNSGVAIPILTPDRANKRQNGRRMKEDGDTSFTLTAEDRHGVAVGIEPKGGIYTNGSPDHQRGILDKQSRCLKAEKADAAIAFGIIDTQGRNKKEVSPQDTAPTLRAQTHGNVPEVVERVGTDSEEHDPIYVQLENGVTAYAIWYEKYQCYITIRKLTPRECFRLQGWSDDYFDRAAMVNSDSQLYKQAGNGVTVPVVEAIGKKIKERENKTHEEQKDNSNEKNKETDR